MDKNKQTNTQKRKQNKKQKKYITGTGLKPTMARAAKTLLTVNSFPVLITKSVFYSKLGG